MTKFYREGENANGLFYDVALQVATQRLVNNNTNLGEEPGETPLGVRLRSSNLSRRIRLGSKPGRSDGYCLRIRKGGRLPSDAFCAPDSTVHATHRSFD